MFQEMILNFLGTPPLGSEWLQYQYAGISFIILLISLVIVLFVFGFMFINLFRR